MEKFPSDAPRGIFGICPPPSEGFELIISRMPAVALPELEIIDEERTGWEFFKASDNEEQNTAMEFADEWARRMQVFMLEGYSVRDCWKLCAEASCNDTTTRRIAHRAVRMLARCSPLGAELAEVYEDYLENEGVKDEHLQYSVLEEHVK